MKRASKGSILLGLFLLCSAGLLPAQEEESTRNEKVIVVGDFEPVINDFVKVKPRPSLLDTNLSIQQQPYSPTETKYKAFFIPEGIKPARIVGEPITQLYRNYLKIGMGSHLAPLAEFYHTSSRSRTGSYGIYVNHFSSWLPIPNYGTSTFSRTKANYFAKRIFPKSVLSAEVFFADDFYHYYGFLEDPTLFTKLFGKEVIPSSEYAQFFQKLGFQISFSSTYQEEDRLHYDLNYQLSNLFGRFGMNELQNSLQAHLYKNVQFFPSQDQRVGLSVRVENFSTKSDTSQLPIGATYVGGAFLESVSLLDFQPYYDFSLSEIRFHAGVHAIFQVSDTGKFYLYPEINASRFFGDRFLFLKLGLSSSFERMGLDALRKENPFISPISQLNFVKNPLNILLNADFALQSNLDLKTKAVYSVYKDAPFFGIDSNYLLQNIYVPIYDNYGLWTLGGELVFEEEKVIRLGAGVYFFSYQMEHEEEAWHRPNYKIDLNASYYLLEKFILGFHGALWGKMMSYHYLGAKGALERHVVTLAPRVDLNLSFEYRYTKRLSAFVLLNNIANQQYFEWTNYPTQRFNMFVGITYSF